MINTLTELGLTDPQAQLLLEGFDTQKKLASGKFFLKAGKISTEVGIITKGKCRFYYNTKAGEVTRWISLTTDFVASLSSFITQQPAPENIQAMEATEIMIMPRTSWLALYKEHEFIRNFWTKFIEMNYIGMEERVFNLIAKSAEERYQWMQQNQPRFIQEVPDKYLASMLGTHPRHLSRIRAQRK